jgi:hypothetical protein
VAATVAFSVAGGEPGPASARHRPEDTVLDQVLAKHWRSYRTEVECANPNGSGLPPFVVDEVEAFLKCGILAHGFLWVVCDGCGGGRLVPFSCKRRGFCPSCLGRRMADFAAHLCDYVMLREPVSTVGAVRPPLRPARRLARPELRPVSLGAQEMRP